MAAPGRRPSLIGAGNYRKKSKDTDERNLRFSPAPVTAGSPEHSSRQYREEPRSGGFCESRVKTRGGYCRRSGRCARLRTIGRSERHGQTLKSRVKPQREVCALTQLDARKAFVRRIRETRKARKDAMPHERGSSPVLPSEFSSIALADRKTRFCRELPATRPSSTAALPDPRDKPLTQKNLTTRDARLQRPSRCPRTADACVDATLRHFAPSCRLRSSMNTRTEPKRRATYIVARPGVPCKSRAVSYLISTVATPSNFFRMASASSLVAFSLIALGAPSTRSLASFRPSEVTSRTALMVLILLAPDPSE